MHLWIRGYLDFRLYSSCIIRSCALFKSDLDLSLEIEFQFEGVFLCNFIHAAALHVFSVFNTRSTIQYKAIVSFCLS